MSGPSPAYDAGGMTTRRAVGTVLALIAISGGLAGCGGNDKPAVCSDLDNLKSSLSALKDVKLEQGALTTLSSDLQKVQSDLDQLAKEAKSQYSNEVSAVKSAASALSSSLKTASSDPNATSLSAVATDVGNLGTAISNLGDAVSNTC